MNSNSLWKSLLRGLVHDRRRKPRTSTRRLQFENLEARIVLTAGPAIEATKVDSLVNDVDMDTVADPGDTLRYTVDISNTGDANASNVVFTDDLDTNTSLVGGSINVSPIAFDDAYASIGNVGITVNAAGGVLANDVEPTGTGPVPAAGTLVGGTTITAFDAASVNGGAVSVAADGSFTYDPAAGFEGSDTFTYTLTDAGGLTSTGTVTITVSDVIWFVDSSAVGTANGTLNNPFTSLAPLNNDGTDLDAPGHAIFVFESGSAYNVGAGGGFQLENNQSFVGEGATGTAGATVADSLGITTPTHSKALPLINGTAPTITNSLGDVLALADGNLIAGVILDPVSSGGIVGTSVNGGTVQDVTINTNGGSNNNEGIDLTSSTGTFTFSDVIIQTQAATTNAGTAFKVSGGSATINLNNVDISQTGGKLIDIQNMTGGGATFDTNSSLALTSGAGDGINLANNSGGASFTFHDLDITTGTGRGLSASNSGTINVTGTTNTIDTTAGTGVGVNITDTTIGASGVTFQSIDVDGASSGIFLSSTGNTGAFAVNGTGTTDGSGGSIQNTSSDAVSLNNVRGGFTLKNMIIGDSTATVGQAKDTTNNIGGDGIDLVGVDNVTLDNLHIARTANHGIDGTDVTNFSLANSQILNAGDSDGESGLSFDGAANNLDGTVTISNSTIDGAVEFGMRVQNNSGTLNMTISGNQFSGTANTAGLMFGEDGLQIEAQGNAVITALINGSNTFSMLESDGVMGSVIGNNSAILNITIDGNTFTGFDNGAPNMRSDNAIELNATGGTNSSNAPQLRYTINNNMINSSSNSAILLGANDFTSVDGRITSNTINGSLFGFGIEAPLAADDNSNARLLVTGNSISNHNQQGAFFNVNDSGSLDITFNNNNITTQPTDTTAFENVLFQVFSGTINVEASGNDVRPGGADAFGPGIGADALGMIRVGGTATLEVGTANLGDSANTVLETNNPNADSVFASGTISIVANGTVADPIVTPQPLFAAVAPPDTTAGATGSVSAPHDTTSPSDTAENSGGASENSDTASGTTSSPVSNDGVLSQQELDFIVQAAAARWMATGLSAAQIAALGAINVSLADMPGWFLGSASGTDLTFDVDAAGWGWYVDATPLEDGDSFSGMDLLTTVMHEMGHVLGLGHLATGNDVMSANLTPGTRRVPTAGQAEGANPLSITSTAYNSLHDIVAEIGVLPFGKTVTITFDALIDNLTNGLAPTISNQGTVSGGNFSDVLTDDPAVGGAADPTTTVLDSLTIGNQIWFEDITAFDGVFTAGTDTGVNGVTLTLYADDGATPGAFDPPGVGGDTQIATTVSANDGTLDGRYTFTGLLPGNYIVQIDESNFAAAAALDGAVSLAGEADPDDDVDNDDNGIPNAGNGVVSLPVTLAFNAEPTTDGDADSDTNLTVDFGFVACDTTVTHTGDDSVGSLRFAILCANAAPGVQTIDFAIGSGLQTIQPLSALPDITDAVIIDGTTQPGFAGTPLIELNGTGVAADGLLIDSGGSTVKGLIINRFGGVGIKLVTGVGNTVEGNFIGTSADGTTDLGNGSHGVMISSSSNNTIGGTTAAARNVISGNDQHGVFVAGSSSTGNVLQGNVIGLKQNGSEDLGNTLSGVVISAGTANTIGGTAAGAGNVISGNDQYGVVIQGTTASGNVLRGNTIGLSQDGTADVGNSRNGVQISNSPSTTIGGATANDGNLISGNDQHGVFVNGNSATGTLVQGNRIGTDTTGGIDRGNTFSGVRISLAASSTIGGTAMGAGNVISGNDQYGVFISGGASTGTLVQGNLIGVKQNGAEDLGNTFSGVVLSAAGSNTVGGTASGAGNVISGNDQYGVVIQGTTATNNVLQGNMIGLSQDGTTDVGNTRNGVQISNSPASTIGGTAMGAGNVISGNDQHGVFISGANATNTLVQGNLIGTDGAGTADRGNTFSGVRIAGGSSNSIGGTSGGAGNVIAFNNLDGLHMTGASSNMNAIQRNSIFSNGDLGIDLGANGVTANDPQDPDTGANNLQNFPVLTSAVSDGLNLVVIGTLNSTPNSMFTVEFFSSPTGDPSGNGEGQTFHHSEMVTTDGSGDAAINANFAAMVPAGHVVTATATDASGNTSEFSGSVAVTGGGPLLAAGGESIERRASSDESRELEQTQLQPIVDAALASLTATGMSAEDLAALSSVTFAIADLPGAQLGIASGNTITLDADAAGYGWYIDATPLDNSEFLERSSDSKSKTENQNSIDLLTVVLHELQHTLGDGHTDAFEALMNETLPAGVRRLPDAADLDALFGNAALLDDVLT